MSPLLVLAAAALLAGCGASDDDPGPGGATVGETRALGEAAEMLDDERLSEKTPPAPGDVEAASEGEVATGGAS